MNRIGESLPNLGPFYRVNDLETREKPKKKWKAVRKHFLCPGKKIWDLIEFVCGIEYKFPSLGGT